MAIKDKSTRGASTVPVSEIPDLPPMPEALAKTQGASEWQEGLQQWWAVVKQRLWERELNR